MIRTVGNPALYKSLQDSIASETRHKSASGAIRRLEQIERDSARWSQLVGKWGRVEIEIDGSPMPSDEAGYLQQLVANGMHYYGKEGGQAVAWLEAALARE